MADTDTMTIGELVDVLASRATGMVAAYSIEDEGGKFYQTFVSRNALMTARGLAETLRDRVIELQKEVRDKEDGKNA